MAVMEMVARTSNVQFRRDQLKKSFSALQKRGKNINLPILAQACTMMGLSARPVEIQSKDIQKVCPPILVVENNEPIIIHSIKNNQAVCGNGYEKLKQRSIEEFTKQSNSISFVNIQRNHNRTKDTFNWGWVWSIVKNYRNQLILVVVISLVAQLFH